jgi:hypothetical protein
MTDQQASSPNSAATVADQIRLQRQMQAVMRGQGMKVYANGIGLGITATDITVLLFDSNVPVGAVTMAYVTAQSLVTDLGSAIKSFEERTGEKVRQIKELAPLLQDLAPKA